MKLRHPESAIVDDDKRVGYCLNPSHSDGQHKARVFKSALDLDLDHVENLKLALLEAVKTEDAIPDQRNSYGQKYIIDFAMSHSEKTAIIHSVWIVKDNEDVPRLVTCYVL